MATKHLKFLLDGTPDTIQCRISIYVTESFLQQSSGSDEDRHALNIYGQASTKRKPPTAWSRLAPDAILEIRWKAKFHYLHILPPQTVPAPERSVCLSGSTISQNCCFEYGKTMNSKCSSKLSRMTERTCTLFYKVLWASSRSIIFMFILACT